MARLAHLLPTCIPPRVLFQCILCAEDGNPTIANKPQCIITLHVISCRPRTCQCASEHCHTACDTLQAEDLGKLFRTVMYPRYGPAGNGFLRLHSTYRHDLKIYTSDEGRVQTSAAAFTQGLLDLEGTSLTPILVR